jgi:Holliday junction resolvasome RuvABC ATP-dependent DNA helicase subunit
MNQRFVCFHRDPELGEAGAHLPKAPSLQQARWKVDSTNPESPFHRMVGQDAAKRKLGRAAVHALMQYDHCCREIAWLLTGPSSVGKTTLAKLFAEILDLPLVEISPKSVNSVADIFDQIADTLANWKHPVPLVPVKRPNNYVLPPCIIFVDEVHALKDSVQHGLLKAVENKDAMLQVETGQTLDTFNACWMIATTDSGDLFDAFDNRFCEINLKPYTKVEIAQIVHKNFPDWTIEQCSIIAHYQSRVPRKALEFAREVNMEKEQGNRSAFKKIAAEIAQENGIDQYGMSDRHLKILKLLSEAPVSKDRLALSLNVKVRELERRIMPPLLIETEDMPALVTVTRSGYTLTKEGASELKKRGIKCSDVIEFSVA